MFLIGVIMTLKILTYFDTFVEIGYEKKLHSQHLSNMYENLYLALKYILCDSREYALVGRDLVKSNEASSNN